MDDQRTGIARAVDIAGGQRALAEMLSSTREGYDSPSQQAVSQWVRAGFVPIKRVAEVAKATGIDPAELIDPALRAVLTSGGLQPTSGAE